MLVLLHQSLLSKQENRRHTFESHSKYSINGSRSLHLMWRHLLLKTNISCGHFVSESYLADPKEWCCRLASKWSPHCRDDDVIFSQWVTSDSERHLWSEFQFRSSSVMPPKKRWVSRTTTPTGWRELGTGNESDFALQFFPLSGSSEANLIRVDPMAKKRTKTNETKRGRFFVGKWKPKRRCLSTKRRRQGCRSHNRPGMS